MINTMEIMETKINILIIIKINFYSIQIHIFNHKIKFKIKINFQMIKNNNINNYKITLILTKLNKKYNKWN